MTKHILSVDGGGIRGIIPALILTEIEKRTSRRIADIFDLMAGTSTGAILIAGLCKKNPQYSAEALVNFYRQHGAYIFQTSYFRRSVLSWFYNAQYPNTNIENILNQYFGNDTLENISSKLLISSYDVLNHNPLFFKSWNEDTNIIKLKDILRAATAAPTYFTPKRLKVENRNTVLIDGGVFANNPAACAYASSQRLYPKENLVLLSIGTGKTQKSMEFANIKTYGKIKWVKPLLDVMFASGLDSVDYQLEHLESCKYMRIQTELEIASAELDNVSPENMKNLEQEAVKIIQENKMLIDEFCAIVSKK